MIPEGLSKTERIVYQHIIDGHPNLTTAALMFVGVKAVKAHITNIFAKLNHTNRYELIAQHYKREIERLRQEHIAFVAALGKESQREPKGEAAGLPHGR